jgi:SPOR domain
VSYRVFSLNSIAAAALVFLTPQGAAVAQVLPASRATASDSVYTRASQLVQNGNGAAGRALVDSMVAAAAPGTPEYAEALYWRARLAATDTDAEQDYRRIVVEYPASSRTADALSQLAQLEVARGDRTSAIMHLERFITENPDHPERARNSLLLIRLAFETNDAQRGCLMLGRTLGEVSSENVELRNQLTYYSPRCTGVDTTRGIRDAHADSAGAKHDTTRRAAVGATTSKHYTVQVCACGTRALADRYLARLKLAGFDARLVGTGKPFRVRVGRYDSRAAANATAAKLKAKKFAAFVTEISGVEK